MPFFQEGFINTIISSPPSLPVTSEAMFEYWVDLDQHQYCVVGEGGDEQKDHLWAKCPKVFGQDCRLSLFMVSFQ